MSDLSASAILPYRNEHIECVWFIVRLCFADALLKRIFMEECDAPCAMNRVVVSYDDDTVVLGFCLGRIIADEYTIHRFAVHPAWQRRGVALRMLTDCVRQAAMQGARHCYIEVRAGNSPALRLYKRSGFEQIGVRPNYYSVGSEDAILMRRILDPEHSDPTL